MSKYMVRKANGTTDGPFTSAELKTLAYEGGLSLTDMISPVGESKWVAASRVGGIREILEMMAPPARANAADAPAQPEPAAAPPLTPRLPSSESMSRLSPREQAAIPQYAILRSVAEMVAWYGWLIIGSAFGIAIFATFMIAGAYYGGTIDPWVIGTVLAVSLAAGFVFAITIRRGAATGSKIIRLSILIALAPMFPTMGLWVKSGAGFTPSALLTGQLSFAFASVLLMLTVVIGAMVIIAVSEFFVAHADIATNSWKR